jgi:capsular polysaccharide transport system permease protein
LSSNPIAKGKHLTGQNEIGDDVTDTTPADQKGAQSGRRQQADPVVIVRPASEQAHMRTRHWGLVFSFLLIVLLPLAGIGLYLSLNAQDQFASETGFTVRSEDAATSSSALTGLGKFIGGGADSGEADMLFGYLRSQDIVEAIDQELDLRQHYTRDHDTDPFFALAENSSIETLTDYWQRIVRVSYDQSTGLITLRVLAFSPDVAQRIAEQIIEQSQILVNDLNAKARQDSLHYAETDLAAALERVKSTREALVTFRTRTQIVDPQSDLQGRMGVLNGLQAQLAQALIDYDLIAQETAANDVRVVQARRRITVIQDRIAEERQKFSENTASAPDNASYPALLAEYERLTVDREYAEEAYRSALAALDLARANAARQSRYLAVYIHPTYPQTAEYPQRWMIFGIAALFLFMAWSALTLIYYAIRDRK